MTTVTLLGLGGLALVDSTSIGTLVLPLLLLASPRVHVGRFLAYLGTVAVVYAAVGLALVGGAGALLDVAAEVGEVRALRWAELGLGAVLLAIGVLGDPRGWFGRGRSRRGTAETPVRRTAWRERLLGAEASYGAVVGVALVAVLLEVGTMVPFLAAVGVITTADLPVAGWVPLVLAYNLVMVAPALLLLAARLALGDRLSGPLGRLAAWIDRHAGGALYVVLVVVGLLLLQDARVALGL